MPTIANYLSAIPADAVLRYFVKVCADEICLTVNRREKHRLTEYKRGEDLQLHQPVSYHVTGFEDPIEGEVLVSLVESSGNTWGGGVVQGGPSQLIKPR